MSATKANPNLEKFITAMRYVYAFPSTDSSAAASSSLSWKPPPASAGHRGRYLWTDAFGILNFITLHRLTASSIYVNLANNLVETVHSTLGRTRDLQSLLPGATPENPLGGGLRIGKEEATGPDGDGQYHHYLTLWMFALNRLSRAANDRRFNDAAIALMKAIHPHFVYDRDSVRPRMYWKMSVDLKTPLVRSEGNLDPVDGLVMCRLLMEDAGNNSQVLEQETRDYAKIVQTKWKNYSSTDPLDLGMTLWTAHWFAKIGEDWADGFISRAESQLEMLFGRLNYFESGRLSRRLAFREFGDLMATWEKQGIVPTPREQNGDINADHDLRPITLVMYAAALIPGAFQKGFI